MRKLIIFLLVLFTTLSSYSQQVITAKRINVTENLKPPTDTLINPAYLYEMRFRYQDTAFYIAMAITGAKWVRVTSGSGSGGSSGTDTLVVFSTPTSGIIPFYVVPSGDTMYLKRPKDGSLMTTVQNADSSYQYDLGGTATQTTTLTMGVHPFQVLGDSARITTSTGSTQLRWAGARTNNDFATSDVRGVGGYAFVQSNVGGPLGNVNYGSGFTRMTNRYGFVPGTPALASDLIDSTGSYYILLYGKKDGVNQQTFLGFDSRTIQFFPNDSSITNKKFNYFGNIHSTFGPYSMIDKSYLDSVLSSVTPTIPALQDVTNEGNTTNNNIIIETSGTRSYSVNSLANQATAGLYINGGHTGMLQLVNRVGLVTQYLSGDTILTFSGKTLRLPVGSSGSDTLATLQDVRVDNGTGRTFYVSTAGNDANSGLSPTNAWQTISKVNAFDFNPGDKILFQGGQTFAGTVSLTAEDSGTVGIPIIIASKAYDNAQGPRAKRSSAADDGDSVINPHHVEVRDLEIYGNATKAAAQKNAGVYIWQNQTTAAALTHFVVDNCVIYSYSYKGITISTWDYIGDTASTDKNFDSVIVTNNDISDCGYAGIFSEGDWPLANHTNLYIGYNKVHHNTGIPDEFTYPTGSGINISGFTGGVIEYNEAYENGTGIAGFPGGGGVGIWTFDASDFILQYNESHHNHPSGGNKDGGGFDFDGGATHSIMQYNYSHDNSGPGFMVYDYGSSVMDSLVLRYNLSVNDANYATNYVGLYFGGTIAGNINKVYVYNNTVIIDTTLETVATPSPVGRVGFGLTPDAVTAIDSMFAYNNIILTNGVPTVGGNSFPAATVGAKNIYWGSNWSDLNFSSYGSKIDPRILSVQVPPSYLGLSTHTPIYKNPLTDVSVYTLQQTSPAIDSAQVVYGLPKYDMLGLYIGTTPDIGAFEFQGVHNPLGVDLLDFPSTASNSFSDINITLNGAVDGDAVSLGVPTAAYLTGINYTAWVSAPNTVTIRLMNPTGGAANPAPAIFKVRILR